MPLIDSRGNGAVNPYSNEIARGVGFRTRRWTARWRSQPHFIIIGAGKCGTTSLYRYLVQHPSIDAASAKEVHYFDHNYRLGRDWYLAHFPLRKRDHITGEA